MSSIASGTTTTTGLVYTSDTTGNLVLQTNGTTTAVTIDTSQNVGVGVTPSASGSGVKSLEIGAVGDGFTDVSNFFSVNSNIWLTTGGAARYGRGSLNGSQYSQFNGNHYWYTYTGNQGAGNAPSTLTQAMTLNNSGYLGIGTSSPTARLTAKSASNVSAFRILQDNNESFGWSLQADSSTGYLNFNQFYGGADRASPYMILDNSGNLLVGTTQAGQANGNYCQFRNVDASTNPNCVSVSHNNGTGSGVQYAYFVYNGNGIGSISQNGTTAVSFNTTSDRRLKTNIVDLTNSGTVIDSLKPRSFTWISDNSADAGFIADEFQTVLPKAVTGQPNATKEEEYEVTPAVKDEQGNITTPAVMGTRTVPDYQMIDASQPELIAYLVAEVQSLRARLKAANIA
jgi:hypothetical protein